MGTEQIKLRWQHLACSVNTYTTSEVAPQSSLNRENVSCQLLCDPPPLAPICSHHKL